MPVEQKVFDWVGLSINTFLELCNLSVVSSDGFSFTLCIFSNLAPVI